MFTVVVNVPGFLPDWLGDSGADYDTLASARTGLAHEVDSTAQAHIVALDDEPAYDKALEACESAAVDQAILFDGYAHTIVEVIQ